MVILSFIVILAYILSPSSLATELDYIHVSQSLSDGMTLVSQGGKFELGFFSPGNSHKRYLGIWYKKIPVQTVVWVANRANPINDFSGTLTVKSTGNLSLTENGTETTFWSTISRKQAKNPVLELLDSGNLVLRNEGESNPKAYLWQSFDYPSDTYLPSMKLGRDLQNGFDWCVTSWKSRNDPSPVGFSLGLVLNDYPEFSIMNGTKKLYRAGPWNGLYLSGYPDQSYTYIFETTYVKNKDEISYSSNTKIDSILARAVINQTSQSITQYIWDDNLQNWKSFGSKPVDVCDKYDLCGAFSYCSVTEPQHVCQCFKGFSPKSPEAWNSNNSSQGCIRDKPLSCNNVTSTDGFVKYTGLKVPDTQHTKLLENINLDECRNLCLKNCSCMAYANSDIRGGGSGCVMWFGDLIDIKIFQSGGQDLYIRMPALESGLQHRNMKKVIIASTIAAICATLLLCVYVIYRVRRNNIEWSKAELFEGYVNDTDLPMFDLLMVTTATDNFSLNNKIGQGGFGTVYKGKLADGQEIAVKRLSQSSGQGMTEFLTEVKLIAKLQHRNLVKLLGCCIRGQEKLLVYEYMVNGSLDNFIFDRMKSKLLEWPQRFLIIFGVARGLLYLHHDSRLRIIHRDLKLSNVLLDDKLNPKISDFGIARAFGVDQTHGNTNRVIGTYGYMAPEYAINGLFSVKSDVFSFGVILMEIISGNRNRALCHANETLNLVGYAWMLWKEDRPLELIDPNIKESCVIPEVLRCIHVSLLCVQQHPEDRPTMASVLVMLGSKMDLVDPKEPGFFSCKLPTEVSSHSDQHNIMSLNDELTITSLDGR
ncbi:G-type lectin S-receptor-like serine/threonine-protein kinase At4g27290 isoform X1 [Arachis ipaensis]|uniref:G-type lectin S-receptor-like serine/threonine-protein kinase At4g27290 isoform X1 n=2 Tax=Arachis ipaensis TaxID=130454 RepID=UPI0007AEF738|nr:G-type lectin S-receptor-like serine/threonine-protein kinase At4g27290 isoform X1 [Arachis ipaensis]